MWQIMEELAYQREREMAARTRSLLVTHHPATEPARAVRRNRSDRSERGRTKLPPLSFGKWRHWSARQRNEVHCSRAATLAGC